ncbi:MAG TPA: methylated-DNA--[protein]-cysteine S-methyltransferase [bacterium]|nr:methylated-DNA--[protein]-cysteine S-methyltransferase [bacterium]HPN41960.1 methylated-DNA--[protein]-cysteine S-methyltransferase [bacterium]
MPIIPNALFFCHYCDTPFGQYALLWNETDGRPVIVRGILSRPGVPAGQAVTSLYPNIAISSCVDIDDVAGQLVAFLNGGEITFSLDCIRLDLCSPFQQKVLRAEHAIPRGQVSSYARIAAHIGHAGAGRAVGTALATNPFPLIIPCHRAVRSDGSTGEYQGGPAMKRKLLEMEGIKFDQRGRVDVKGFYY